MPVITNNDFSEETHPWNFYIPDGATKLFIGTFPTEKRNRKHDFFYSSSTNRFWEIMFEIVKPFDDIYDETDEIEKRKIILKKLKLGLTDIGAKILRQQGSSNDHSLFPLEFIDITQILSDHKSIKTIILTGDSKGNSSLSWFGIFCSINNISLKAKKLDKIKTGEVIINNQPIQVRVTYSTSRLSRIKTNIIIDSYKPLLLS
jgi:G:T/U-mismatch repair DNA glycosylase